MTIDDYLDAALAARGFPSDRQLSLALGHNGKSITLYRTKRAWPDDATMIRLAQMANIHPARALMDLNIWRAKDSEVQALYSQIAAKIAAAAIAMFLLWPGSGNASATNRHGAVQNYTLCDIIRRLSRWINRIFTRAPLQLPA